ncbi:MAG: hypothetical protein DME22_05510 [Verrucomicrobia bacterium]|nr:MAG: hypothetical protein DME22_05510 [Verrucomicrobiota bacterium]PYK00144.1 MAG: hypothetical protein DME23_08065 [Verrucomicrobiota bacterium]
MNVLASIKNFFRDTAFSSAAGRTKAESALAKAFLRGQDVDAGGDRAKLSSPYSQSSWVYTAVSGLAEGISQIPFRFSRKDQIPAGAPGRVYRGLSTNWCRRAREAIVDSGPVVALFERPHEHIDRDLFWQYLVVWEALRGEFFIVPLDADGGAVRLDQRAPKIAKLLVLSPDFFWHRVIGYKLEAWRYTGSPLMSPLASQYFLPEELIHKMRPNPYLFWRGLSPLTVALLPAQSDYAASQFMKGLMLNNADTGLIATSDQWLSQEQREQVLAALRERKRMAGTADRPVIMGGGLKLEKPAISSADMQFLEHRKLNRLEIGAIFKVPATMMGFTEDANRAIAEQERLTFIENTLAAICKRLEVAVQPIIRAMDPGLEGWFDIDSLPIMQLSRRDRMDTATKAWSVGISFNEINEVYDLGFPDAPERAVGYLPFSVQPITPAPPAADNPAAKALRLLLPSNIKAPEPKSGKREPNRNGKKKITFQRDERGVIVGAEISEASTAVPFYPLDVGELAQYAKRSKPGSDSAGKQIRWPFARKEQTRI